MNNLTQWGLTVKLQAERCSQYNTRTMDDHRPIRRRRTWRENVMAAEKMQKVLRDEISFRPYQARKGYREE